MSKQIKPLNIKVKNLINDLRDYEIFELHELRYFSSQVICRMYGGIHHTKVFWSVINTIQEMPFGYDSSVIKINIQERMKVQTWLAHQKAPIISEIQKLAPKEEQ